MVAFTADDERLDTTFSALAHPIRRGILTRLARDGSASVSDLAEPFDVSLMAVSKHLKVMDEAGLIRKEKDGRVHRCSFEPGCMDEAKDWIEHHRRYWADQLGALAAYLEGSTSEPDEGGVNRFPETTAMVGDGGDYRRRRSPPGERSDDNETEGDR